MGEYSPLPDAEVAQTDDNGDLYPPNGEDNQYGNKADDSHRCCSSLCLFPYFSVIIV